MGWDGTRTGVGHEGIPVSYKHNFLFRECNTQQLMTYGRPFFCSPDLVSTSGIVSLRTSLNNLC